jgi:lysophospholipase L1-like esterase
MRSLTTLATLVCAFQGVLHAEEAVKIPYIYHDLTTLAVEGQGWPAEVLASRYDRLPAKAEKVVPDPVWNLSRHSAGISFRFVTDATRISIQYQVGSKTLGMTNMPPTGASGVDLYALAPDGKWKWVDVTKPKEADTTYEISGIDPGKRTYFAYLPLFNSTTAISIGVPEGSSFEPVAPRPRPIVFYGTSITHGASASRPGMTHVAILGRRLDRPVINLGFSGNGKMEAEVGALLAEIDAAVYVIDCLPNMSSPLVEERAAPLVRQLRQARPDTPILLVEDRSYANAWIKEGQREHHKASRAALVRAYDTLVSSGVKHLYYLPGEGLIGDDTEGTTDGSHPNDLGFVRQADAFEPVLRRALAGQ